MERVLHQPEGRAGKRLQGISERHGAEGSVRFGKWETQKIGAHRVGCCFGRQSVAAAAEQVLDGSVVARLIPFRPGLCVISPPCRWKGGAQNASTGVMLPQRRAPLYRKPFHLNGEFRRGTG